MLSRTTQPTSGSGTTSGPPANPIGSPVTSVEWGPAAIGGGAWTLTLTVVVNDDVADGTVITNTAVPTGGTNTYVTTDAVATVTVEAPTCDLSINKDADESSVAPGDEITYTITVKNEGDTDCADLIVEDDLSDTDLECVSASINDDDDLHFDEDALSDSCDDNDVVWQLEEDHPDDVLPSGDSVEARAGRCDE